MLDWRTVRSCSELYALISQGLSFGAAPMAL